MDVPLPTCGSTSDKLSAGETLDKWFLPRAVLAYKRLLWYVSNCFSLPFPWQKYRVVCFVKNWQKLWTETHKTVDDPAGVLLKLLRLEAVRTGAVVHLLPLKDSNLSTPSSELSAPRSLNILYLPIFKLFRDSGLPPGLTPLIYKKLVLLSTDSIFYFWF